MSKLIHADVTEEITASFYEVYNELGYGFLEKVHENAMAISTKGRGLVAQQQWPIYVEFHGQSVGKYFADLYVNGIVLVEIKTCEAIADAHKAQLLNYLTATKIEVGLIFNFGPEPSFSRKIMTRY